ncbi:hypothetical protein OH76DRAFT_1540802, partial [Lentinus brumalis]
HFRSGTPLSILRRFLPQFCSKSLHLFVVAPSQRHPPTLMAPSAATFPKLTNRNYQQWKLDMEARLRTFGALRIVKGEETRPQFAPPLDAVSVENFVISMAGWTWLLGRFGTVWRGSSRRTWSQSETILVQCGRSWRPCTCRNVPVRVLTPTTRSYPSPRPRTSPSAPSRREPHSSSPT